MQTPVLLLVAAGSAAAVSPTEALTGAGFAVLITRTASGAMQALDRVRPDIIVVHSIGGRQRQHISAWQELAARAVQLGTRGYVVAGVGGDADPHAIFPWPVIEPGPECQHLPTRLHEVGFATETPGAGP